MKIGVFERPRVFTELGVVGIFDLMKVIFVELPDERGKVGVFKHARENRFREFVHVLYDKAITVRTPRYHMRERLIFQHLVQFLDKVARRRHVVIVFFLRL